MDGSVDLALATILEELWPGTPVRATPLAGGITNRNFTIEVGPETLVLRLAGPRTAELGIDRDAEVVAARAAASVGVGPEVVTSIPERGILVTRFVDGSPIPAEDLELGTTLDPVVRSIRAFHGGRALPSRFPVFQVIERYRDVAAANDVAIPNAYIEARGLALRIERALGQMPAPLRPCHNDLLNANFLRRGDHVWIVDYEYAGMGDPFFDLANLSINNGLSEDAQQTLLRLYLGSVHDRDRARLGLMRVMSDLREAMWGVVQQGLSTLEFDYAGYADMHFTRLAETAADARFEDWLLAAGGAG